MKCTNWLNRVLENRELRTKRQRELYERYNSTLLSLTINIPGHKKSTNEAKIIYDEALKEIEKLNIEILEKILTSKETGYEAIYALHVEPIKLKQAACKIEENHPLGRFMDIDVLDCNGKILSRGHSRKCYLCDDFAKNCARSQKHSCEELQKYINKSVNDFRFSL